jgi:hypothetical protein
MVDFCSADETLRKVQQFNQSLKDVGTMYIPREVVLVIWDAMMAHAFASIVEGYSKVRKVKKKLP